MFKPKQNLLNTTVLCLLSGAAGVAHAADTYTMSGGSFDFYDASGLHQVSSSHQDVDASINFTAATGSLSTSTNFNGYPWSADVTNIFYYDGAAGGAFQTVTYSWQNRTFVNDDFSVIRTCRTSGAINGCAANEADPSLSEPGAPVIESYTFNLTEGQFALGLFFDWSTNADIPVLAAFNIDSIDSSGNMTVSSVDTGDGADNGANGGVASDGFLDGDGVPGTKMATSPFPEQTPAFSGIFTAATNDAPITGVDPGSDPLTTDEDASITLATSDFTTSTTVFPSRVYQASSKTLYIADGADYTTNNTSTVTPDANIDTSLTVPVGLNIDAYNGVTFGAPVSITANNNDAPAISCSYNTSAPVNTAYSQTPTASDPDTGDTLVFSFTSDAKITAPTVSANTLPTGMSFNSTTGAISGTPTVQNEQSANIVVTVTDTLSGGLTSSCPAFSLTVTGPNTDPVMSSGTPTGTVNEDSGYSFDVDCSDSDIGDSISSYALSGNPAWMTINSTSGLITGTPDNSQVATTTGIVATCNDTAGGSDSVTFSVTVNNTNDAPTISAGSCTSTSIEAEAAYSCAPTADDVDVGDTLTFSATGLPSSLSIDSTTGAISGTTVAADAGVHSIVISVTDTGFLTTSLASYSLTISAFNQPPVASKGLFKSPADTSLSGTLVDLVNDPENCNCLIFRQNPASGNTAFGSIVINADGSFVYTPDNGYNGTDSFNYIATDEAKDSNTATVQILVGTATGETYAGSNFTMFDAGGANANGGTNDVIASWDGLFNTDESDADFTHMTLSSITPYFGELWTAHHIRVFGPGTYTFDTTCTVAELEAGMGGSGQPCNNPLGAGQVEQFITMTVAEGQVGAHILFDWSTNLNIDVLNVWNVNSVFDVSSNPGTGVLYNGEGYGAFPWSGAPSADTVWRLASTDNDGDGIPGVPMVDGAFIDFNANFNLDIVSTGSNFTMFDAGGANANGGTNDVIASWDGLFNTDESDIDFTHMTLSSITPYFGELWTAHHIRVFGPGTYTFDTTCTVAELEAGMGGSGQPCNNPLGAGQVEQFITMTVAEGQVGAHILFDWSTNLNIDVLNVWNVNSAFDVSSNPGTGVIYNGEGYGPYPWSGAPSADTSWRLASTDNDGDGIPGISMVDGAFIDFNANFNLFVGSGDICEPAVDNNFCGTIESNTEVADPDLGGGSAYGLTILSIIWLCLGLYRRQIKV